MQLLDQLCSTDIEACVDFFRCASPEFASANGIAYRHRSHTLVLRCPIHRGGATLNRGFGVSETLPRWREILTQLVDDVTQGDVPALPICARASDRMLADALRERGFAEARDGDACWIRPATPPLEVSAAALPIVELGPEHGRDFDLVCCQARDLPSSFLGWTVGLVGRERWRCFGALDGDRVVATGAIFFHGDHAWLGYGSTLATHRGRGLQAALINVRIAAARAAGASLLTGGTAISHGMCNDPSFVNMRRAGFALAYEQRWFYPTARR